MIQKNMILQYHYKSFFEVVYSDQIEDSVLLDVLFEDNHYHQIEDKLLSHPFIKTDGSETIIHVPSVADMLGDKLTAFAPNTCGVPYYKGTHNSTINVAKQLHVELFIHIISQNGLFQL